MEEQWFTLYIDSNCEIPCINLIRRGNVVLLPQSVQIKEIDYSDCKVENDSNFSAQYVNMNGLLASTAIIINLRNNFVNFLVVFELSRKPVY